MTQDVPKWSLLCYFLGDRVLHSGTIIMQTNLTRYSDEVAWLKSNFDHAAAVTRMYFELKDIVSPLSP